MTAAARLRVGVLVSGSGTNLQALLDAARSADYPAEISVVVSNVPGVKALDRARAAGVPTAVVDHRAFPAREAFEAELLSALRPYQPQLVCLAGFMRLLGAGFLQAFTHGVLNIHPALLPAFPGLHAVRQALDYGVKVAGCTVHFVDEGVDSGPVVAQAAVPVLSSDDEATLSTRVREEEHRLYPRVVRWVAEGRVQRMGRRTQVRE